MIRSAWDRRVAAPDDAIAHAHQTVRGQPVLTTLTVEVPREHNRPARKARVEVRRCPVRLSPKSDCYPHRQPVDLTLVEVWEPHPPEGLEPLHWLLWTAEPVETAEQAEAIVGIYKRRRKIEDFHLTLKSGCRVEDLQFETPLRLAKMLVLYGAVAVRILQLRDLSRQQPDVPCTTVLSDLEWRTLWNRHS